MDDVDNILEARNAAEAGPATLERQHIPPEFLAGNKLSDALDIAEKRFGSTKLWQLLEMYLHHRELVHWEYADLNTALGHFFANVSEKDAINRIQNRIKRLKGPA